MTKNISINNQQISIELTNHCKNRITERKIPLNILLPLNNILNSNHKKHVIKYIAHNIIIIIKKDSNRKLALISAFSGLYCNTENANVINLH